MEKCTQGIQELHKEIDLIQSCITRMAQNSFMVKGWAFALVLAFMASVFERLNLYVVCGIGMFVLLAFWYLDAFFLKMEKLYRFKYEWVINARANANREYMYDLNPYQSKTRVTGKVEPSIVSVMFSRPFTLLLFYGSPMLIGFVAISVNLLQC